MSTQPSQMTPPIEILPVRLGPMPGYRARIGLIGLSSGMTCEQELHDMLPDGTLVLTTRVANEDSIDLSTLAAMESELERAASTLLPQGELDVVIYSCTSGTIAIGEEKVFARIRSVKPDVAITTPFTAAVAALKLLGVGRIVLMTPYTEPVTRAMRDEIERRGLDVLRSFAFGLGLDSEMSRVTPDAVREAALAVDLSDAEGLFISCTALRTSPVIEEIEQAIGKPVVTSNQALVWHALRLAGFEDPITGLGHSAGPDRQSVTKRTEPDREKVAKSLSVEGLSSSPPIPLTGRGALVAPRSPFYPRNFSDGTIASINAKGWSAMTLWPAAGMSTIRQRGLTSVIRSAISSHTSSLSSPRISRMGQSMRAKLAQRSEGSSAQRLRFAGEKRTRSHRQVQLPLVS